MYYKSINRILLGLLMLVPGLLKLFMAGPSGVSAMLSGMGFPASALFAWILILAEIGCGAAILANYKLKWAVIPPAVIMVVIVFVAQSWSLNNAPMILLFLAVASSYMLLGMHDSGRKR